MGYCVYYLYSPILQKHYIGKTENLNRRLLEHNLGQEKFTRKGTPWELIGYKECPTSAEAVQLENKLKKAKNIKYVRWYIEKNGVLKK